MNVRIRIGTALYEAGAGRSLASAPFAAERVGFLFGRLVNVGTDDPLILMTTYSTLAYDRYIDDPFSGARSTARRFAGACKRCSIVVRASSTSTRTSAQQALLQPAGPAGIAAPHTQLPGCGDQPKLTASSS